MAYTNFGMSNQSPGRQIALLMIIALITLIKLLLNLQLLCNAVAALMTRSNFGMCVHE